MKRLLNLSFLLILLVLLFPSNLVSQAVKQNEHSALVELKSVETLRKQNSIYIRVAYKSYLPADTAFHLELRNVLASPPLKVDRLKTQRLREKGTARLGPFPDLWEGTYQVSARVSRRAIQQLVRKRKSNETLLEFPPVDHLQFKTSPDVLLPSEQQKIFFKNRRNLLVGIQNLYLDLYPDIIEKRKRIGKRQTNQPVGKWKKEFRTKGNQRVKEVEEQFQTLKKSHVFGSPYREEVKALGRLWDRFLSFVNQLNSNLFREWSADHPHYGDMSVRQRMARDLGMPDDYRVLFLYRFLPVVSRHRLIRLPIRRMQNELHSSVRRITEQFLKLLELENDRKEKIEKWRNQLHSFHATVGNVRQSMNKMKQKVDRWMWLFRDLDTLPGTCRETRDELVSLRGKIDRLNRMAQTLRPDKKDISREQQKELLRKLSRWLLGQKKSALAQGIQFLNNYLKKAEFALDTFHSMDLKDVNRLDQKRSYVGSACKEWVVSKQEEYRVAERGVQPFPDRIGSRLASQFQYAKKETEDHSLQQSLLLVTRLSKQTAERMKTAKELYKKLLSFFDRKIRAEDSADNTPDQEGDNARNPITPKTFLRRIKSHYKPMLEQLKKAIQEVDQRVTEQDVPSQGN